MNRRCPLAIAALVAAALRGGTGRADPQIKPAEVRIGGQPAVPSSPSAFGMLLVHRGQQSQIALMDRLPGMVVSLRGGHEAEVVIPISGLDGPSRIAARARNLGSRPAEVDLGCDDRPAWQPVVA
ncbi:MAG: hypothetical protein ACUVUC_16490, partial [Thermoguttaceae bacterium]